MDSQRYVSPFEGLHKEVERFFEEARGWQQSTGFFWERNWRPRVNLYTNDAEVVVLVELAGIKKDKLDIRSDARTIYLSGERDNPLPADVQRCHHLEIPAGPFQREINLPEAVDPTRVKVSYDNGWLEIRLPRAERIRAPIE